MCVWIFLYINIMLGCERIELFYSATVKSMIGRYIRNDYHVAAIRTEKSLFQYTPASCVLMFY